MTPAFAGNMQKIPAALPQLREDPRVRGEYVPLLFCHYAYQGRPPRSRGIYSREDTAITNYRLTPAFAGNIQDRKKTPPHQLGRPPRSRGIFLWPNEAAQLRVDPCICREMFAYLHPDTPQKVDPRVRGEYLLNEIGEVIFEG